MDVVMYRTFVGRERRPVEITRQEFDCWVSAIAEDESLRQKIVDIDRGLLPYGDLDEGDAGIFHERAYPHEVSSAIENKLSSKEPPDRRTLAISLHSKIIQAVLKYNV